MKPRSSVESSLFDRVVGTSIGAVAGVAAYVAWFVVTRLGDKDLWTLSGPFGWFILIGALLGATAGARLARDFYAGTLGELRGQAFALGGLVVLAVAVIAVIAVFMYFYAG